MTPVISLLAGPNGAGKTTFYEYAVASGILSPTIPFLNIDHICRDLPGGYTAMNLEQASAIYRERVQLLLKRRGNFLTETNLARQSDYDWIEAWRRSGYRVFLYFLCADDVLIHIDRVANRVREGGHDVAETFIRERYSNSLSYLHGALHRFDEAVLIDTSSDIPVITAQLAAGNILF